uniref:uncharacterized protein LOC122588300 n=1 Tax=Erigeron canadensis TaxID=72917 RepID=UPI001CB9D76B|nr:uncharacterized protein LOC122588300 [Erigeron canadensis]
MAVMTAIKTHIDHGGRLHGAAKAAAGLLRSVSAPKEPVQESPLFQKGGLDAVPQLEQAVPPESMSQEDWRALLGYYQREDRVKQSARNSTNRGKQVLAGTHGRKSYSQYVHQEKVEKNKDVDLVDLFEIKHKKMKDKQWEHPMAEEIHSQLKKKKEEAEQDPVPTPDPDIVMDVRGPRAGHRRGIERVIRQMGTEAYDYTHLTQGQPRASFDLNNDPPQPSQTSSLFEELFNYSSYAQAPFPPQPSQQLPTASPHLTPAFSQVFSDLIF